MTLLQKIGKIIQTGLQIVGILAPVVETVVPGATGPVQVVSQDLAQIAQIVVNAEAMGQALGIAGPDKLKAAAPQVAQIIMSSALLANHQIANGPLFTQAATKIADGVADLLNSLKDNIPTTNKAA